MAETATNRSNARLLAEYCVPAMAIGALAAIAAGGLAVIAGQPTSWSVATGLALGVPIALVGTAYASLVALEKVPTGAFTTAALAWLVGYPLARLVHQVVTEWLFTGSPGLPPDPLGFLAYNALLSVGFAIGFVWLQEQIGAHWWPRLRGHNPYARRTVERYVEAAVAMQQRKRSSTARYRGKMWGRAARVPEAPASGRRP
jgi:hypothetical protein